MGAPGGGPVSFRCVPSNLLALLTFWDNKVILQSTLRQGIAASPGDPGSLQWRAVFRSQDVGARCAHCPWIFNALHPLHRQLGHKRIPQTNVNVCVDCPYPQYVYLLAHCKQPCSHPGPLLHRHLSAHILVY